MGTCRDPCVAITRPSLCFYLSDNLIPVPSRLLDAAKPAYGSLVREKEKQGEVGVQDNNTVSRKSRILPPDYRTTTEDRRRFYVNNVRINFVVLSRFYSIFFSSPFFYLFTESTEFAASAVKDQTSRFPRQ